MQFTRTSIGFFLSVLFVASCQVAVSTPAAKSKKLQSNGVALATTILRPDNTNGTGVVMLPGSGPATRAMIRPAADKLVAAGITVLIFDKRGSGESGGDWTRSSLDELAGDAISAMNLLRQQPAIDHVGLWAHSQGNWVATRAAELGGDPKFLIAVAGGGVSPREVELRAYQYRVSALADEQQAAAMQFVDAYFDYLSGDIPAPVFDGLIEQARTNRWFGMLEINRVLVSAAIRPKWQWVADYDPAQQARERNFPVLVLLGGADHSIPLQKTVSAWNRQLTDGATTASRIEVLVGRDHHLRDSGDGHGHGVTTDDTFWDIIALWLNRLPARRDEKPAH